MRAVRAVIIVAIVVIAALALPQRAHAPVYAQEMAAVRAITTIHTAQIQYYSQYGHYAGSLTQLGPPTSGASEEDAANLIDRDLASGDKGGFKFVLHQTPAGYALQASPTTFGPAGAHTYFSDQSMTIHQHRGQEAATVNDQLLGGPAHAPLSGQELAAANAIGVIQRAETSYILNHGNYTDSLQQLGIGVLGGKVTLRLTTKGYDLTVRFGNRTYYADQTMTIHARTDGEPATVTDPQFGELIARQ